MRVVRAVAVSLLLAAVCAAQTQAPATRAWAAMVTIRGTAENGDAVSGSGFLVSSKGTIGWRSRTRFPAARGRSTAIGAACCCGGSGRSHAAPRRPAAENPAPGAGVGALRASAENLYRLGIAPRITSQECVETRAQPL